MDKRQQSLNRQQDSALNIADVIRCGDIVHIEHVDSFFEVLEIISNRFIGIKLGEDSLENYTFPIDDVNTIWLKSHSV
jgi:hypothetical protein